MQSSGERRVVVMYQGTGQFINYNLGLFNKSEIGDILKEISE